jgi:hypothetical protein
MTGSRAFVGARLRRALLVGVGVAAMSLALASGALAATQIDTTPSWNNYTGSGLGFCCFGPSPNATTMGQTVTVPATDTRLDSFTFYADLPPGLLFRGEVYAWNGSSATGSALYESSAMQTTQYTPPLSPYPPGGCNYSLTDPGAFQPITFNTGGINLTAGAQYVLFVTISRDYAADAGEGSGCWGTIHSFGQPPVSYSGGSMFWLNDGGNPNLWTTTWNSGSSLGWGWLAFKACFSGPCDHDLALPQPSNVNVDATSPAGAAVTYTNPVASDEDLSTVSVNCVPASGSTFAIGDTTVACTATDTDGDAKSPVHASFNVHVEGAAEQLSDLAKMVNGVGTGTILVGRVALVQSDLAANDTGDACRALGGFINEVNAWTPSKIPPATAKQLIADAQQIGAVIGCAPLPGVVGSGSGHPWRPGAPGTLFDNNNNDSGAPVVSQNFESEFAAYDSEDAGSFTVPAGQTWKVNEVLVTGQYFAGSGPATSENVRFYANQGQLPGIAAKAYLGLVGVDNGSGSFDITLPTAITFTGGPSGGSGKTYWMSVVANMDFLSGGEWGWEGSTNTGFAAAWRNPADGFGAGCTSFATESNCVGGQTGSKMFALIGVEKAT